MLSNYAFFFMRNVCPEQNTAYEEHELACRSLAPHHMFRNCSWPLSGGTILPPCSLTVYSQAETGEQFHKQPSEVGEVAQRTGNTEWRIFVTHSCLTQSKVDSLSKALTRSWDTFPSESPLAPDPQSTSLPVQKSSNVFWGLFRKTAIISE